jgi:hypothetical protein
LIVRFSERRYSSRRPNLAEIVTRQASDGVAQVDDGALEVFGVPMVGGGEGGEEDLLEEPRRMRASERAPRAAGSSWRGQAGS